LRAGLAALCFARESEIEPMEAAANPLAIRSTTITIARSAVPNGKRLHFVRPSDTAWARRFKDMLEKSPLIRAPISRLMASTSS
jgi:hypothetical protein